MTSVDTPRSPSGAVRAPVGLLRIGLLLTVASAVAVVVDQATGDSIGRHLREAYPGFDPAALDATGSMLVTVLFTVATAGVLLWLLALRGVARQRRWARPFAVVALLLGATVAATVLAVSEYGGVPIYPTWIGVLVALPCLPGLAAVVMMFRPRRISRRGSR
jgi:hypothetical protein